MPKISTGKQKKSKITVNPSKDVSLTGRDIEKIDQSDFAPGRLKQELRKFIEQLSSDQLDVEFVAQGIKDPRKFRQDYLNSLKWYIENQVEMDELLEEIESARIEDKIHELDKKEAKRKKDIDKGQVVKMMCNFELYILEWFELHWAMIIERAKDVDKFVRIIRRFLEEYEDRKKFLFKSIKDEEQNHLFLFLEGEYSSYKKSKLEELEEYLEDEEDDGGESHQTAPEKPDPSKSDGDEDGGDDGDSGLAPSDEFVAASQGLIEQAQNLRDEYGELIPADTLPPRLDEDEEEIKRNILIAQNIEIQREDEERRIEADREELDREELEFEKEKEEANHHISAHKNPPGH